MLRVLILMLGMAFAQAAFSDPPRVQRAIVDENLGLLTLHGRGFAQPGRLVLLMNGGSEPLTVVAVAQTHLVARLPERLPYGSYVLRLVDPEQPQAAEEVDVVVGVVGPEVRE